MRISVAVLSCLSLMSLPLLAQPAIDSIQPTTIALTGPPNTYLPGWSNWTPDFDRAPSNLAPVGQNGSPNIPANGFNGIVPAAGPISDGAIYIVHIVDSSEVPADGLVLANGDQIQVVNSRWYFYRYSKAKNMFVMQKTTPTSIPPIYGVTNGYVISISRLHWNSQRFTGPPVAIAPPIAPALAYSLKITQGTPANQAALLGILGGIANVSTGTAAAAAGPGGGIPGLVGPPPPPPPPLQYTYKIEATKISATALKPPYTLAATATISFGPAAGAVAGTCQNVTSNTTCPLTQTLTITDYEHWDVGVNIVAYGPNITAYGLNTTNSTVVSGTTRQMPLYGVFDYSPWASKCPMTTCGYFQGGLPFSGAVLHSPYAGISWPLPTSKFLQISAYFGVSFIKQTKLHNTAVGATPITQAQFASASYHDWTKRPIYGIEVPVSSIISKIKSSVGGGGGGK
jgi:hypothetical protein